MILKEMTKSQLEKLQEELMTQYEFYKAKDLKLDMSRGKPGADQLDLSMGILDVISSKDMVKTQSGVDCRNYGVLDGIDEAKALFSKMIGVAEDEILVGGNSSLNIMYDTIAKAMIFGLPESEKSWSKYEKIKFLCPVPGYDRHFAICESMGIEMINIPMTETGPDMDMVEKLVSEDDTIKGIWCVPMYSNPEGITYSDETVKRFASMKTKAKDFRIFWDNAYCVHHISDTPDKLLNIMDECKKCNTQNRVFIFGSTSKVSFPGAGVAMMGASKENLAYLKKLITIQTIGSDKINQLRHVKFFKDIDGINAHMKKHKAILQPKFKAVLDTLEREIEPLGIASWHKPNGGYFISFNTMEGCAKRVGELCAQAGVKLTPVGATFPYRKDPNDRNIRIAPTFPPVEELQTAINLFCICVKIASIEKLLNK